LDRVEAEFLRLRRERDMWRGTYIEGLGITPAELVRLSAVASEARRWTKCVDERVDSEEFLDSGVALAEAVDALDALDAATTEQSNGVTLCDVS
jgi:hypothetical protein